jgi:hypothetical protein
MRMASRWLGPLLAAIMAVVGPAVVHAAPTVTVSPVSPATGVFTASQGMDLVLLIEGLDGLAPVGAQVLLDENDITGIVLTLFRIEPIATGLTLRSPHIPMGFLGLGTHTFRMIVTFSDGSQVTGGAIWNVLR